MESGRSLKSWDAGCLKHLGTYVEYALLHNLMQRPSKDKTLNSILLNLLSNRSADYMSISRQLTSCGWAPEHSYLCMMLAVTYLDQQNLTENAICDYVENVIHGSCAFSFRENIVIYVDMDLFGGSTEDITEKLIYFIRDSFLKPKNLTFGSTPSGISPFLIFSHRQSDRSPAVCSAMKSCFCCRNMTKNRARNICEPWKCI